MLSVMIINRERQSNFAGWETYRDCGLCDGQWPGKRLWDLY